MTYVFIVLGAAVGAPLRYFVSVRVYDASSGDFPYATLVVNLTGCFLIGILATIAEERDVFSRDARLFLLVGLLGSYTTFSTFGWETLALLRANEVPQAFTYVGASAVGGLAAVWAGLIAARSAA